MIAPVLVVLHNALTLHHRVPATYQTSYQQIAARAHPVRRYPSSVVVKRSSFRGGQCVTITLLSRARFLASPAQPMKRGMQFTNRLAQRSTNDWATTRKYQIPI